ncbi:MAG TPA: hypothetical protein VF765_08820 [Polyangiaceae bacterium]
MSDPTRFRDGGGGEIERLVVDSVRHEGPSSRARRRVEAAIGLGAAISTTTATTSALGASVKTGAGVALGKWIAIAAVTAAAGAGAAAYVQGGIAGRHAAQPANSAARVQQAAPPVATVARMAPPVVTSEPVVPSAAPEASVAAPAATPPPVAAPPAPSTAPALTLGEQLQLLDQAHAAMGAGETTRALSLLDRYDREARKPALAPEVMALRVEIHARRGDRASAARLATQFLALYGDRPEAQRVRSILNATSAGTNP